MKIISLECPECGATLNIQDMNREFYYCQYCRSKVMVYNENERIVREINEARIKEIETKKLIRLRELEIREKEEEFERRDYEKKSNILLKVAGVGVIVAIIGIFLGSISGDDDSNFYLVGMLGIIAVMVSLLSIAKMRDDIKKGNNRKNVMRLKIKLKFTLNVCLENCIKINTMINLSIICHCF